MLLWLNILAALKKPADEIVRGHWATFGRDYYARHDYEDVETGAANDLMDSLRGKLAGLPGQRFGGLTVGTCDDFSYTDPVDGSLTPRQGIRILFREDARAVFRLSGTGTSGATLRVYLERYEPDAARHALPVEEALAPVERAAGEIAEIAAHTGRDAPTVIT